MSAGKAVVLAIVVIGVIFVMSIGGCIVGTVNHEVALRKAIQAKSVANEATLDTMWKIIKQKAQIAEKNVSEIKDMNKIYEDLVQGRSGGALFKMVTENYPNLAQSEVTKLYAEVMTSVEAERKTFKRDQQALVDVNRERDTMINQFPSSMILGMFGNKTPFYRRGHAECPEGHPQEFTYMFVTAGATKVMVESGEENDIDLFNTSPKSAEATE